MLKVTEEVLITRGAKRDFYTSTLPLSSRFWNFAGKGRVVGEELCKAIGLNIATPPGVSLNKLNTFHREERTVAGTYRWSR